MQNSRILLLIVLFSGLTTIGMAQKIFQGTYHFDTSKNVYITLPDGSELEGTIQDMEMSKGILKNILFKDVNGKMYKFMGFQIQQMYIAAAAPDYNRGMEFLQIDANWEDHHYRRDLINRGYVVFELSTVEMGGKQRNMLLQLLNPSFSNKIRIYNDPWLTESEVQMDMLPSYFVKDGGFPAAKLESGQYKDYFYALFGECESMLPKRENARWTDLAKHVFEYNHCK